MHTARIRATGRGYRKCALQHRTQASPAALAAAVLQACLPCVCLWRYASLTSPLGCAVDALPALNTLLLSWLAGMGTATAALLPTCGTQCITPPCCILVTRLWVS